MAKNFPRIAEIKLESSEDGKYVLATVANGDGGEFAHYVLGPEGGWKQVTQFSDEVKLARLGRDNALYLLSRAGAPRGKILRLPLETPELAKAIEIVPASEAVIQQIEPSANALYVVDLLGGPSQVRRFNLDGKDATTIPVPSISAVQEIVALDNGALLYRDVSYTEPAAWFEVAPGQLAIDQDSSGQHLTGFFFGYRGDTRIRAFDQRRKGAAEHHSPEGNQARWEQSNAAVWLRWLRPQYVADLRFYPAALVRSRRASMSSPTSAAEASLVKNGTRPVT